MSRSGSPRKLLIDGVSFNLMADADVNKTSSVLNEATPHSGGNSFKQTRLPGDINSVTADVSTAELEQLETFAENILNIPLSLMLVYPDGSKYTGPGFINLAEHTSQDNKVDITLFPNSGKFIRLPL